MLCMFKTICKIVWLNIVILSVTLMLGVGEFLLIRHVDSQTYEFIFFLLLVVLYCNIVAKCLVSLIRSYDKIA